MIDRAKVIKGLECCITDDAESCLKCPYCATMENKEFSELVWHCREMKEDALALLKAHEPLLYTVDELKRGEHYYLDLHLELTGDGIHYAEISSIDSWSDKLHGKFKAYDLIYGEKGASYMYEYTYGWTWRCWTSRPTDEQRKAVKWDG